MKTIDHLLDEKQFSIERLAEASGLSAKKVMAIVDGRWTPSPAERERIASAFGVSVDEISWGHNMNPRNQRYHRYGLPEEF